MTIEEAKQNIKEHCYFANLLPQAKESLDIAIKSLDMWDKVTDELEELRYNGDFKITYSDCIKRVLDIIERYKKEIEE